MGEKIETSSSSSSSLNGNVNVNDNGRMVNKNIHNKSLSCTKFPLTFWEMAAASGVVLGFGVGLSCVYLTMPHSDYSFLKLPRNLNDIQTLRYLTFISFFKYVLNLFIIALHFSDSELVNYSKIKSWLDYSLGYWIKMVPLSKIKNLFLCLMCWFSILGNFFNSLPEAAKCTLFK